MIILDHGPLYTPSGSLCPTGIHRTRAGLTLQRDEVVLLAAIARGGGASLGIPSFDLLEDVQEGSRLFSTLIMIKRVRNGHSQCVKKFLVPELRISR